MSEPVTDVALGRPPPALRPFVEGYRGYRLQGFEPGVHRCLPGRHLTFIISLGDPVEIAAMPDPRQPPAALGACPEMNVWSRRRHDLEPWTKNPCSSTGPRR